MGPIFIFALTAEMSFAIIGAVMGGGDDASRERGSSVGPSGMEFGSGGRREGGLVGTGGRGAQTKQKHE